MKDWEISRSYVLPRILYVRGGNDVSTSKLYKPNLRFFSLREECNDWKIWKRSDYFYPEIIPEPDYSSSDSGEEEDEVVPVRHYFTDPRSAIERLRELTEVYVSNVDLKKTPSKKVAGSQARPKPKAGTQKTNEPPKSKRPPAKSASKTLQARRSPSPPSKTAPKSATKSTSKTQQGRRSPSPPSKTLPKSATTSKTQQARRSPSPPSKTAPKSAPRKKSPPKVSKPKGPQTDNKSPKPSPRPKSPPSAKTAPRASPSKPTTKSPPSATSKEIAAPKGKAAPETAPKAKATPKEPGVSKLASPSGDSKDVVGKTPPSSPTRGKSPLRSDQSSDDEQLIKPKKPYSQQSTERLKLHQELKFSQRYGKPGSSKTELQLALQRYTENKMKRELMAEEKTSLEKILELQAKKIEMQETTDKCPAWVERLQRPPVVEAGPETEEFFRVHARVVSSNSLTHCFLSDDEKFSHSDTGSDS